MMIYKQGNTSTIVIVIALVIVAAIVAYYITAYTGGVLPGAKKNEVVVTMNVHGDSAQSGTATLTNMDGKTKVVIEITQSTATLPQPVNMYVGMCPNPTSLAYRLNNVVQGRSETILDVSLMDLKGKVPFAINVHKSLAELAKYVSCGTLNIEAFERL